LKTLTVYAILSFLVRVGEIIVEACDTNIIKGIYKETRRGPTYVYFIDPTVKYHVSVVTSLWTYRFNELFAALGHMYLDTGLLSCQISAFDFDQWETDQLLDKQLLSSLSHVFMV
jgi:hypothetical protein